MPHMIVLLLVLCYHKSDSRGGAVFGGKVKGNVVARTALLLNQVENDA